MPQEKKLPRAAGTRGWIEVMRSFLRGPSEEAVQKDLEETRRGVGRTVSCALRGSAKPYPKRFKHGMIDLIRGRPTWRPYWWSINRNVIVVQEEVSDLKARPRNPRTDWNIKSAGAQRPEGFLWWSGFSVLVCTTDRGWFEL